MREIFKNGQENSYIRGDTIDIDSNIHFVNSGSVAAYSLSGPARKMLVIYVPGDVFPYTLPGRPIFPKDKIEFVALDTTFLLSMPRKTFDTEAKKPEFIDSYITSLTTRLNTNLKRIDDLTVSSVRDKIILRLLYLAERLGQGGGDKVVIDMLVPHCDIAQAIGTTRETVNRTVRKLEAEGLITNKQQALTINSMEKLRKLV